MPTRTTVAVIMIFIPWRTIGCAGFRQQRCARRESFQRRSELIYECHPKCCVGVMIAARLMVVVAGRKPMHHRHDGLIELRHGVRRRAHRIHPLLVLAGVPLERTHKFDDDETTARRRAAREGHHVTHTHAELQRRLDVHTAREEHVGTVARVEALQQEGLVHGCAKHSEGTHVRGGREVAAHGCARRNTHGEGGVGLALRGQSSGARAVLFGGASLHGVVRDDKEVAKHKHGHALAALHLLGRDGHGVEVQVGVVVRPAATVRTNNVKDGYGDADGRQRSPSTDNWCPRTRPAVRRRSLKVTRTRLAHTGCRHCCWGRGAEGHNWMQLRRREG
eukprot:PhM_4_TR9566/c0_g1_i2/m.38116